MCEDSFSLGIDLGTSGVRIAVINSNNEVIYLSKVSYQRGLDYPEDWRKSCETLIKELPIKIRERIAGIAVDGTSGTLVACQQNGRPLNKALPYNICCHEQASKLEDLKPLHGPENLPSGSLARALRLVNQYGENILLRHQADWINGWLLGNWQWGEEGNNLKLGWDIQQKKWPASYKKLTWKSALPEIVESGQVLGKISADIAEDLLLPPELIIVAGTTDSNAAVLAANPGPNDGITVLGSTLVIKRFVKEPILGPGLTNHFVNNKWLCGGSSNTGGAVLKKFFNDEQLEELSKQINPNKSSGFSLRPLVSPGERFPINDPELPPVLEPRPISDALYLHALFEGMADIEAKGWEKLSEAGVQTPQRLITIGGGARNSHWRKIREKIIGLPIISSTRPPAAGLAILCSKAIRNKKSQ